MENNLTQEVVLPSRGLLNKNIPGGKIVQRCMRVYDQKYLSGSSASDGGMRKLLQETIVSPENIKIDSLCVPDTIYLLMTLRSLSYGSDLKVSCKCPHCGKITHVTIDISKLEIYDLEEDYESSLSIKLPHSGDTVHTRILLNADFKSISEEIDRVRQMSEDPESVDGLDYILKICKMIKSVKLAKPDEDGETELTDPVDIRKYVDKMTNYDATAVLATVESIAFGISDVAEVKCSICGESFNTPVPVDPTFFRPKFDLQHKRSRRK